MTYTYIPVTIIPSPPPITTPSHPIGSSEYREIAALTDIVLKPRHYNAMFHENWRDPELKVSSIAPLPYKEGPCRVLILVYA